MKKILKKTWSTVITILCFIVVTLFAAGGCDKSDTPPVKTGNNVSFTPCKQNELRSSELSSKADVEFTDKGVQITYYNFEVTCDFTDVNVSHTFTNGILNITQEGSPNQANCICYTDVSYTIEGISKDEVNVIFINDVQVYCHNDNEVEQYVNALKNNQYDDRDLPAFTYKHIDKLLEYRNEKDIITKFPYNPISSLWLNESELGIYILWTIESIRAVAINREFLNGRFPSQNPILNLRDSEFVPIPYNSEAYQILSNAYYTWWTSNKDKTLIEIMEIDPLENTIYKWH